MEKYIALNEGPLQLQDELAFLPNEESGAVVYFVGYVRGATKGRLVSYLEFESYDQMAISEMDKIIHTASKRWPIIKAMICHAKGIVQVGELAVIVGVACGHRKEAFEACAYMIDTLKVTVPIWKREFFEDGAVWVSAHP